MKNKMKVNFVGDLILGEDIATSIDDVSKMIKSIKSKLAQVNGGKGVPIISVKTFRKISFFKFKK